MSIIGTLPGERLAGLLADTCHKIQHGGLALDELALFNQRKNPFNFERNKHGHIVLMITGLDLTGEQEIERLTTAEFRLTDWAKSCLLSKKKDGYDKNHRLVAGQRYKVALMPMWEIERASDRTTDALRKRGVEKYGYEKPRAGIVPRIRESVSDNQMEEVGFRHIAAPHDPIKDSDGAPRMLCAYRCGGGRWLGAFWDRPDGHWGGRGAFAFLVPKSSSAGK